MDFFNTFWIVSEFREWHMLARHANILPSLFFIVSIPVMIWLLFASAFVSATISEMKSRNRLIHFVGGFIIPVIYPLVLTYVPNAGVDHIETKKEVDERKRVNLSVDLTKKFYEKADMEEEYIPSTERNGVEENDITGMELLDNESKFRGYDKMYFASIAVNENGTPAGPFEITLDDGRVINAQRIIDPENEVVILEIIAPDGNIRTVRALYDKITDCQLKS